MADSAKAKDPINPLQHQPPNLKTWSLKTSIHCEGCKKKVKKIVNKTPGVYSSDVDLKQQKVIVTGNIDVNALISRLIKKTGKHAELWPEVKTEQEVKKQSKPKPKPKPSVDEKVNVTEVKKVEDEVTKEKPTMESSVRNPQDKNADEEARRNSGVKPAGDAPSGAGETGVVKEPKDKQMKPPLIEKTEEIAASEKPKEAAEAPHGNGYVKKTTVDDGAAADGVSGNFGKKKKKKGQNEKQKFEGAQDEINENQSQYNSTNHSLPRHYPAHMHGPPPTYRAPPVYTVSYNTTQYPSSSYGASYYAMPPPQHTEAYAYAGSNAEYQPSDFTSYQSQPSDTFQIFSDENPNACSLM